MMGFIPTIVHIFKYDSNLSQFEWFPDGASQQTDFFFAWKMIAIIVVASVMAVILFCQYYKDKELKFETSFYFVFFYLLFVGMSALFSPYKYWVVRGGYELFEPVWVVFAYVLICYYVYNYVSEESQVDFILRWSGIGMAIVTLIGVFQYFRMDFFKTGFGKHLITSRDWWDHLEDLSFTMAEGTSYTTLYNPNFLSFYFGMLIPLLICLFIGAKKVWHRVLIVAAEILCLICLRGSNSASGWMALAIGAVILVMVLLSRKKKLFYAGASVVALGMIAAIVLANFTSAGQSIKNTVVGTFTMKDKYALNDIKTEDDGVILNIRGNEFRLVFQVTDSGQAQMVCDDADGKVLDLSLIDEATQTYRIDDERFEGVQLQPMLYDADTPCISVTVDDLAWNFVQEDNTYFYMNDAGKKVKFEKTKQAHLFFDDAMSMRGHIWNNTIPLLPKHFFIGSGADTYIFEYPQNDYLRRYMYGGNTYDVKAHCWYLQQGVETGGIGTILLIVFLLMYLIQSIRIYRRADLHERISWVGYGLFSAVLVYMIAAVANDSNVCTAPVFWGMLGLGIAVNRIVREKQSLFLVEAAEPEKSEGISDQPAESRKEASVQDAAPVSGTSTNSPAKNPSGKKQSRKQRKNKKK